VITDNEWNQFELIKEFLELFKEVTIIMSGSKYSTLTMTIPLYNELIDHTEDYMYSKDKSKQFLREPAKNCREKLLEYYNKTNDAYLIATILDPRFKMVYFAIILKFFKCIVQYLYKLLYKAFKY